MHNMHCSFCKHAIDAGTCAAFPEGIPREIIVEGGVHRKPFPGDHGIQFELSDSARKIIREHPEVWKPYYPEAFEDGD